MAMVLLVAAMVLLCPPVIALALLVWDWPTRKAQNFFLLATQLAPLGYAVGFGVRLVTAEFGPNETIGVDIAWLFGLTAFGLVCLGVSLHERMSPSTGAAQDGSLPTLLDGGRSDITKLTPATTELDAGDSGPMSRRGHPLLKMVKEMAFPKVDAYAGQWAPSFDWCRFRRDTRCYFPEHLDEENTQLAGYVVYRVADRGACPRFSWEDQRECRVSQPGPNSDDPDALIECTRNWDEGGQRDGHPRRRP